MHLDKVLPIVGILALAAWRAYRIFRMGKYAHGKFMSWRAKKNLSVTTPSNDPGQN